MLTLTLISIATSPWHSPYTYSSPHSIPSCPGWDPYKTAFSHSSGSAKACNGQSSGNYYTALAPCFHRFTVRIISQEHRSSDVWQQCLTSPTIKAGDHGLLLGKISYRTASA